MENYLIQYYTNQMDKNKYGVHRTHCCKKHGCKYGDKDCPVVLDEIKQDYECEFGDEMDDPCFGNSKETELLNRIKQSLADLTTLADGYENDYVEFSEWLEKRSQNF